MRYALVLGNSEYDDLTLARLNTPVTDTRALAEALNDPLLGQFDSVISIVNQPEAAARRGISQFLAQKKPDDLVLLYFSCHGILDERGRLYLAAKDTQRDLLKATGISASFITDEMDSCRSRRQVLILDCCYGGAFARGTKSADAKALTQTTFEGAGYGRVVLTASDSTQFALEGDQVVEQAEMSLFTHFMLHGLTTGEADLDRDGQVTLDELYDYTYNQVVSQTPRQTPCKWSYNQQGELVIARNPHPIEVKPAELPPELRAALDNPYSSVRLGAVDALRRLLGSSDPAVVLSARMALEQLNNDDSRSVSEAAGHWLAQIASKPGVESVNIPAKTAEPVVLPEPVQRPVPETKMPDPSSEPVVIPEPVKLAVPEQKTPEASAELVQDLEARESRPPVKASKVSLLSTAPANFWPGWIGALVAGVAVFFLEVDALKSVQVDYPILSLLSMIVVGVLTGGLQWLILRGKVRWAGGWLAGNILAMAGIGVVAATSMLMWEGMFLAGLLLAWLLANLIAGPILALRQMSSNPPGDLSPAVEQPLDRRAAVRSEHFWLNWLGCTLAVVLIYLFAYEGTIRNNLDFSPFLFVLLGTVGGLAGLLQWALLSRFRSDVTAWAPANILALGIVAAFTAEDPVLQRALLFTWLVLNVSVGARLMLGPAKPAEQPKTGQSSTFSTVLFWFLWAGMVPLGVGLVYLGIAAITALNGEHSPANYFILGSLVGTLASLGQWLLMRRRLPGSWWWVAANGLALGWVGYSLSPYHSTDGVGNVLNVIYILANLAVGISLILLADRKARKA